MILSYFNNIKDPLPKEANLEKIIRNIKGDMTLFSKTMYARQMYASDKAKGDKIKRERMPAFAPAAILAGGKKRENISALTGLCFLDIDGLNEFQAKDLVKELSQDPFTAISKTSISGRGVHLIVKYEINYGSLGEPTKRKPSTLRKIYKNVFLQLAKHYSDMLGVPVDTSGENAERLCIISHDPDIYYNSESKSYIYDRVRSIIRKD